MNGLRAFILTRMAAFDFFFWGGNPLCEKKIVTLRRDMVAFFFGGGYLYKIIKKQ